MSAAERRYRNASAEMWRVVAGCFDAW